MSASACRGPDGPAYGRRSRKFPNRAPCRATLPTLPWVSVIRLHSATKLKACPGGLQSAACRTAIGGSEKWLLSCWRHAPRNMILQRPKDIRRMRMMQVKYTVSGLALQVSNPWCYKSGSSLCMSRVQVLSRHQSSIASRRSHRVSSSTL